jgi:hypothetical protein
MLAGSNFVSSAAGEYATKLTEVINTLIIATIVFMEAMIAEIRIGFVF